MTEPDVGRTVYKYRKDGQIRFSQNSHQRSLGTKIFSFTNYDDLWTSDRNPENVNVM